MKKDINRIVFRNISKTYPGVIALKNINVELKKGEIHGFVGKNGAGKSTFVGIIYGRIKADSNSNSEFILYNGNIKLADNKNIIDLNHFNPIEARKNGIYLVPQEPPFAHDLSIEENFFLQKPIMDGLKMDRKKMRKKVTKTLLSFKLNYYPNTKIQDISMEDCHLLYAAMVIDIFDSKVILLDEVTSALRREKKQILFDYLNKIKDEKIIVLITHKIPEVLEICDIISVFRNGEITMTSDMENLNESVITDEIVGKSVKKPYFSNTIYSKSENCRQIVFNVINLTDKKYFRNINIKLHKREILGITGLMESGVSRLLRAISGIHSFNEGEIFFNNLKLSNLTPEKALNFGIAYCTNDRIYEGLFCDMSVMDNMNISILEKMMENFFINIIKEKENYEKNKELFNLKVASPHDLIMTLSGGNQQKVILSRLTSIDPNILILDGPTKGIDIGTKYEILKLLREWVTKEEKAIIINSSSIEELMIICDRIITIFQGKIKDTFEKENFDEQKIFKSIQGVRI